MQGVKCPHDECHSRQVEVVVILCRLFSSCLCIDFIYCNCEVRVEVVIKAEIAIPARATRVIIGLEFEVLCLVLRLVINLRLFFIATQDPRTEQLGQLDLVRVDRTRR